MDHLIHDAIGAWVDLSSGVLGRVRTHVHLDYVSTISGADRPFGGFQLPHWPEIMDLALHAAAALPWVRSVGWDIVISEGGLCSSKATSVDLSRSSRCQRPTG